MIYRCKYFKIQELVSPIIFYKYGDFAWSFFSENILKDLDKIREKYGSEITINTWLFGGNTTQCGYRSNMDKLVKDKTVPYASAHTMGKAFDLHSKDNIKLFETVYQMINQEELSEIRRLEDRRSTKDGWVHCDSFQTNNIVFR